MLAILPFLIGGLLLFLFAVTQLSDVLKEAFSEKAKRILARSTRNLFLAILTGTVVTIALDSSSAVIIMTIVFVNARALTFRQAIGIVMGANIGTTISSQLIALDIGKFSILPLAIGLVMQLVGKTEQWRRLGAVFLYFGMLFFGLYLVEDSVEPLKDNAAFKDWIARLDQPWRGALIGGVVTLLIQSSSATVGLAITLGKQNLISIAGGIAVMLGAELGTCSDTLLATIRGSRQAVKTGLFHLVFNLLTIVLGLILFTPFLYLVERISAGQSIDNHIANAHVLFNVLGVVLFLPLAGLMERALNRLLPEKN